jgi:hypothetical protein
MSPTLSSRVSIDPRTGNIIVNPTVTTPATTQELAELRQLREEISLMRAVIAGNVPAPQPLVAAPHWRVIFPAWPLLLIAAIPTLHMCVSLIRKRRRRSLGLCGVCAYDLTGNQSGVCPECGTAVPVRPST